MNVSEPSLVKMDREAEDVAEPRKRAAPLSTVSLDSTYDRVEDHPSDACSSRERWDWATFVVLLGLVLLAAGLVLGLDHGSSTQEVAAESMNNEGDPSLPPDSTRDYRNLTAPQKKLVGWWEEARNSSEVFVEAESSGMSLSGVLFPRNGTVPFDAVVALDFDATSLLNQQLIVLSDGRGYESNITVSDYGDTFISSGCVTERLAPPLSNTTALVSTARWTSDKKRDVEVTLGGDTYAVKLEKQDSGSGSSSGDAACWLIESAYVRLHACIPGAGQRILKSDLRDVSNLTSGCPSLTPNSTRSVTRSRGLQVPLPLRKWYASYDGSRGSTAPQ